MATAAKAKAKLDMMALDRDLVAGLMQEHRLRLTIRPDGQIIGFLDDRAKLRSLVEAHYNHKPGARKRRAAAA
jgi:hypothetical protein